MDKKLIVGLGNPGEEYKKTRHNIGFIFVEELAKKHGDGNWETNPKIGVEIYDDKKMVLAKPQRFVNESGQVVKKLKNLYKIKNENIIIAHDDLDIPYGRVKLSFKSNSAGHRGVESIIKALGTKDFYRLRFGTLNNTLEKARKSKDRKQREKLILDFVMSPLSKKEKSEFEEVIKIGIEKVANSF